MTNSQVTVASSSGAQVAVPDDFLCPLTMEVMENPLITRFGHSYERSAILEWLQKGKSCPLTRNPLRPSDLISNLPLKARIQIWRKLNEIPEPSPEDTPENHCGFVAFLPVTEKKHDEVLARLAKKSPAQTKVGAFLRLGRRAITA